MGRLGGGTPQTYPAPALTHPTPTHPTPSYNLRVVECRLAAALIARKLGAAPAAAAAVRTLREVEPAIAEKYGPGLKAKVCGGCCWICGGLNGGCVGFGGLITTARGSRARLGRYVRLGAWGVFARRGLKAPPPSVPPQSKFPPPPTLHEFPFPFPPTLPPPLQPPQLKAVDELLERGHYLQDKVGIRPFALLPGQSCCWGSV